MSDFEDLNAASALVDGDLLAIYDQSNNDARRITLQVLLDWFEDNTSFTADRYLSTMQYPSVSASGFSITATDTGEDVWMVVTADGAYATGTIVFPASPVDQQEIWYQFDKTVTSLTIDGNGATVSYTPAIATAGNTYKKKYDLTNNTWYHY